MAGRGVGLDVVRANLNALNGEIDIQSTSGKGNEVYAQGAPHPDYFFRPCSCAAVRRISLCLCGRRGIRRLRSDEIEDVGENC